MRFYSVQIREFIEIPDDQVEIVTMKNGKKAAQASIDKDGKTLKLFKIISKEDGERLSL